jgi:transposase
VLVLPCAEGLADRQAADAVRSRIDWQDALGLELTDPGFNDSVLSEFRARLIAGGVDHLLRETLLTSLQERGLLQGRGTQRPDSTPILAALRRLNRPAWVGEALRFALNRLAAVAPVWWQTHLQPAWLERDGARVDNDRLPRTEAERQRRAATIGADGFALLQAVFAPETPPEGRTEPAVEVLRRIWVQPCDGPDDPPRWRRDGDVPPSPRLIHAPDDLEARDRLKRGRAWMGHQVQMTETCDDATPHGITPVETTRATPPEDQMLDTIHAPLAAHALLPPEHLVDRGDTDAAILVASVPMSGVTIAGPVAADPSWQAREATGDDKRAFTIAWESPPPPAPRATRVGSGSPTRMGLVKRCSTSALPKKPARPVRGGLPAPEPTPNRAR